MTDRPVVLDLCGGSGSWSKPYADAGYDVRVITLPDRDVIAYRDTGDFPARVYAVLMAPPCDHFSVSGAQYWPAKDADGRTAHALAVVDACLDVRDAVQPEVDALENPIGRLRKLRAARLGEPALMFDPCDYGDPYTKRTILWGHFTLPTLSPVEPIRACSQGSWIQQLGGKSEKTKRLRSTTPPGFARAFFNANNCGVFTNGA